jgi:hypothetical protein
MNLATIPHLIQHFEDDGVFYTARTPLKAVPVADRVDDSPCRFVRLGKPAKPHNNNPRREEG